MCIGEGVQQHEVQVVDQSVGMRDGDYSFCDSMRLSDTVLVSSDSSTLFQKWRGWSHPDRNCEDRSHQERFALALKWQKAYGISGETSIPVAVGVTVVVRAAVVVRGGVVAIAVMDTGVVVRVEVVVLVEMYADIDVTVSRVTVYCGVLVEVSGPV